VFYYLGFAPPRLLRRAWQLSELYRFLQHAGGRPVAERASDALDRLTETALRVAGGVAAIAAIRDEDKGQLVIRAASGQKRLSGSLMANAGTIGRAWQTRRPAYARTPAEFSPEGAQFAAQVGATASLAVPIITPERSWGLLVVFLRRSPLFVSDDLDLLSLFGEQVALTLDYAALLAEQRTLIEQLRERTDELEVTNRELESFSYSVSHDLRAPLRAIDGFSRIILEEHVENLPPEGQRYLGLVRDNAQQMGQLVDNLLSFSRLGRQPLKKQPVAPGELVQQVVASARESLNGRQVEFTIGNLPPAHADSNLLRQVFVNLIDNALKFTRGRETAVIEVGATADDGYYVRDNGVGFDMRYADKLFGVFQRLHRAEDFEGVGAGLAIVQRIIHRHGGKVWAEAEVDRGATFYFTLGGDTLDAQ
jgi:signal transduction histidine kinase